jgi:CheY-like chemotaxis protein
MEWRPQGLWCELRIPQVNGTAEQARVAAPVVAKANGHVEPDSRPKRALLVEDEALVAMMMEALLVELGVEVVGPFGTLAEAMLAAKERPFDVAILDVNLDGGTVYPLAQHLSERNVPFAFVTGYEPGTIDSCFRAVPVLQKPVERQMMSELLARLDAERVQTAQISAA